MLVDELEGHFDISFEYSEDLFKLHEVDIICTATGSTSPLFSPEHIKAGTHINAIGSYKSFMQEIHPEIIRDARLYVDQKEACLSETGDILIPLNEGLINEDHILGELGELLTGVVPGRISESDTTIFKSVGVAAQDLFVANAAYVNSRKNL